MDALAASMNRLSLRVPATAGSAYEQNEMPTPRVEMLTIAELEREEMSLRALCVELSGFPCSTKLTPKINWQRAADRANRIQEMRLTPPSDRAAQPWLPRWREELERLVAETRKTKGAVTQAAKQIPLSRIYYLEREAGMNVEHRVSKVTSGNTGDTRFMWK